MLDTRAAFLEPTAFPWLEPIRARLPEIQAEARQVLESYAYLRFSQPDLYDSRPKGIDGQRATFYLKVYGQPVQRNRELCPAAAAAAEHVPGLVTSGIYLLGGNSRILPHTGATDLVWRGHLGVICPPGCYLRVDDQTRGWGDGEFLIFDDMLEHEAWNETDNWRAILMFDFFRGPAGEEEMQALRERFLTPAYHMWLQAAGTPCEAPRPLGGDLKALVDTHGLFFP